MPQIEGFRVQNYRALHDVTLGKLSHSQKGKPLSPFTVVIGKNGSGKSTLFDAFGFVADCLTKDVETACDNPRRGGFTRMRSTGTNQPIRFEIHYRNAPGERPITYQLAINIDDTGHPFVESEQVHSTNAEEIACWFIDTDYNEERFFVRHAYFLGSGDPYKSLKNTLKAEIDMDAWATLNSDISRPFDKPKSGRIAVKVINHLGDEVMKVFRVG